MRKFTLTLLALLTAFVVVLLASAPSVRADAPERLTEKGFLKNRRTGERVEIPVEVQQEHLQDGHDVVKSFVRIPRELLGMSTVVKGPGYALAIPLDTEHTYGTCDGSNAVCATLTQYFSTSGKHVAIDYTKGMWQRMDSQVSWSNAYLEAACYGLIMNTSNMCNDVKRQTVGDPSSGQWYNHYVWWDGTYVETGDVAYVSERNYITITRGGSQWDLGFCISEGGSSIMTCH